MSSCTLDRLKALARTLESDNRLHFMYQERDLLSAARRIRLPLIDGLENALKKGLLYATKVAIVTPEVDIHDEYNGWSPEVSTVPMKSELLNRFNQLCQRRGIVTQKLESTVCFLPERVWQTFYNRDPMDDAYGGPPDPRLVFQLRGTYQNRFGLNVAFCDPHVSANIFETLNCNEEDLALVNIWLPHLRNIPFDVFLQVRDDERDSFTQFHFALKRFMAGTGDLDSKSKLKDLFEMVDYEVRSFEGRLHRLKSSRALAIYEAVVGFAVVGLCFALPSTFAKVVTVFLGSYEGKRLTESLIRIREEMNELKSSDFYVPWLYGKAGS